VDRDTHLTRCLDESGGRRVWVLGGPDVDRATSATQRIRATFPVLLGLEDRKNVLERPALGSVRSPAVEVALHAARPDHRVDAAAAAEYASQGKPELSIGETGRRLDWQAPVQRTPDVLEPDTGIGDRWPIVHAATFDEQDVGTRLRQLARDHRARRAGVHDDVIVGTAQGGAICGLYVTGSECGIRSN
jgi:hypothetical protein